MKLLYLSKQQVLEMLRQCLTIQTFIPSYIFIASNRQIKICLLKVLNRISIFVYCYRMPGSIFLIQFSLRSGLPGSRTESIVQQSIFYHVEARSRVLFINLPSYQSTPPFPSLNPLLTRQSMGDLAGLMRFGSKYRSSWKSSDGLNKSVDGSEDLSGNYSEKAMELSVFGSKV